VIAFVVQFMSRGMTPFTSRPLSLDGSWCVGFVARTVVLDADGSRTGSHFGGTTQQQHWDIQKGTQGFIILCFPIPHLPWLVPLYPGFSLHTPHSLYETPLDFSQVSPFTSRPRACRLSAACLITPGASRSLPWTAPQPRCTPAPSDGRVFWSGRPHYRRNPRVFRADLLERRPRGQARD